MICTHQGRELETRAIANIRRSDRPCSGSRVAQRDEMTAWPLGESPAFRCGDRLATASERVQGRARAAGDRPGAVGTDERRHPMSGAIGQEVSRVDGPAKVTGAARYSGRDRAAWAGPRRDRRRRDSQRPDHLDRYHGRGARRGRGQYPHSPQHAEGEHGAADPVPDGGPAPGETFFPMQDDVVH